MVQAWVGEAPEAGLQYLHPEIEYDVTVRPDGKIWHGPDGVRRAVTEWVGAWSDWSFEVEGYVDAGDHRVAFLWSERGTAKGSGVPMSLEGITVATLHDGAVVSMVASVDRKQTLRELGVDADPTD
jgi:hypothetical protein